MMYYPTKIIENCYHSDVATYIRDERERGDGWKGIGCVVGCAVGCLALFYIYPSTMFYPSIQEALGFKFAIISCLFLIDACTAKHYNDDCKKNFLYFMPALFLSTLEMAGLITNMFLLSYIMCSLLSYCVLNVYESTIKKNSLPLDCHLFVIASTAALTFSGINPISALISL